MSLALTEKLIQRQLNHWNRLREYLRDEPGRALPQGPVITISRLAGSGGRTLAEGLCARLGCTLHDRSLVEKVVRERKLPPDLVARLDEQDIRQSDLWVRGVLEQRIFLRDQYRSALVSAVEELAARGDCVFLGRGANHVLGQRADVRVRLVASRAVRLARLQERLRLTRAEARAVLAETDRQRAEFVRKVFQEDPELASHHDLVINTDRLSADDVQELVLLALLAARTRRAQTAGTAA